MTSVVTFLPCQLYLLLYLSIFLLVICFPMELKPSLSSSATAAVTCFTAIASTTV